jgi:hypothetical protein
LSINLIELLKRPKGEGKIKGRKKISAFIVCLFVAALFWFLNALSKSYNAAISFPVVYINLPENKVLTHELPQQVTLELNAQGFHILAYQFRFLNDSILIDAGNLKIREVNGHFEAKLPTANRVHRVSRQLSPDVRIHRIAPDTVYFTFGTKKAKEVPVKLNHYLNFEKQHRLRDRIIISPSSIRIEGLDELVGLVNFIETDSLVLNQLNSPITTEIPLKIPDGFSALNFSTKSVMVTVPVEKYTEVNVEIPVEVLNLPDNLSVRIFPETVHINCIVGFSDFDKVNPQLFSARIDFEKRDNTNRLPVEIVRHPDFVQILRYQPQKVEYLIRKK